jgi:hypothetical protein
MRKDMFKVIVERPRQGGSDGKDRREKNTPLEDLPSKQSMRRKHFDRKSLNENLKPLERFFRSRIGHKWDDVFSELCEQININSTVQNHVRQHVKQLVHLHCEKTKDGKILDKSRFWGGTYHEIWHGDLYVDPVTGILRRYKSDHKRKRWTHPSPEKLVQERLKAMDLIYHDGVLYKIERAKPRSPKYDVAVDNYVPANMTHACADFDRNPIGVRTLVAGVIFDVPYFRKAKELIAKDDARRAREKAAEERKRKEQMEREYKEAMADWSDLKERLKKV